MKPSAGPYESPKSVDAPTSDDAQTSELRPHPKPNWVMRGLGALNALIAGSLVLLALTNLASDAISRYAPSFMENMESIWKLTGTSPPQPLFLLMCSAIFGAGSYVALRNEAVATILVVAVGAGLLLLGVFSSPS